MPYFLSGLWLVNKSLTHHKPWQASWRVKSTALLQALVLNLYKSNRIYCWDMSVKEANYDYHENSQCNWDWILCLCSSSTWKATFSVKMPGLFMLLGRGRCSPLLAKNSTVILLGKSTQCGHSGGAAREQGWVLELLTLEIKLILYVDCRICFLL